MRKVFFVFAVLLTASLLFAGETGVVKKSITTVEFKGFGKYMNNEVQRIIANKKWSDSRQKFKGQGFLGKMAGKFIFKSPHTGEIIDLSAAMKTELNHKKKEYRQIPIKPIVAQSAEEEQSESGAEGQAAEPSEKDTSNIKIIRNEFRVEKTGNKKTMHDFPCEEYLLTWILEMENTDTGERMTDSLHTAVWTTKTTGEIKDTQQIEKEFSMAYLQKFGLDQTAPMKDLLGTKWLKMFAALSRQPQNDAEPAPAAVQEMRKIEGYPILIDGAFYVITPKKSGENEHAEAEEEEEEDNGGGLKGMFGRFAKKKLKKKKHEDSGLQPLFKYRTEVEQIQVADLGPDDFAIPANYKLKK